jgi:hypothetical protein
MLKRDESELWTGDYAEPWTGLSDAQLLAASQREPEAFGVFYERHGRAVLGFFTSDRRARRRRRI